jgi:hypothetical protein
MTNFIKLLLISITLSSFKAPELFTDGHKFGILEEETLTDVNSTFISPNKINNDDNYRETTNYIFKTIGELPLGSKEFVFKKQMIAKNVNEPSSFPTDIPSEEPSSSPTDIPSVKPSSNPTNIPTINQNTHTPSATPSATPTSNSTFHTGSNGDEPADNTGLIIGITVPTAIIFAYAVYHLCVKYYYYYLNNVTPSDVSEKNMKQIVPL